MANVPDGSYALFRSDQNIVELISDMIASRTIWYIKTENIFIASTSQRAIIYFLQDFKPNKNAHSWMLSSGSLGPGLSWDSRIQCLSGNTRLFLNRSSWNLRIKKEEVHFEPLSMSIKDHEIKLKNAIEYTFEHLRLDYSKWILTLSGGSDSRAILLFLKKSQDLTSVTYGLKTSSVEKYNDAYIAKSLARYLNLRHEFFKMELSDEPTETILNRFLVAGEGRIDNISAYIDGFKMWKYIYESGYQGVLRADEVFGCRSVSNNHEVYRKTGLITFSDYEKLNSIKIVLSEYNQRRPDFLERRDNESLETWRDRIDAEFQMPVKLAALNDLKLSYIEVACPLLSRKIVQQVRKLPDPLRTNKQLFRKIVRSMSPENLKFAKYVAIANIINILRTPKIANLVINELSTTFARTLFPNDLLEYILNNIEVIDYISLKRKKSLKTILKQYIPASFKTFLKNLAKKQKIKAPKKLQIDPNIIAFRAYIICKMNRILTEDANSLPKNRLFL